MPRRTRFLAVAVMTPLVLGAGAARALASGPSPLVRAIEKVQYSTDLGQPAVNTAAEEHKAISVYVANAFAREQAADLVARIPAAADQQAGKAEWLSGIREGVVLDVHSADAVFTILSGHRAAGLEVLGSQTLTDEGNRINRLTSQADYMLGAKFPPPPSGR